MPTTIVDTSLLTHVLELLYVFNILLLGAYGFYALFQTWIYWHHHLKSEPLLSAAQNSGQPHHEPDDPDAIAGEGVEVPKVTVQLPIYNERYVVTRLIDAVAALDWPQSHLHIQILDDSTDDTTRAIAATLARYQAQGIQIEHLHRSQRVGFKAGALQQGLATCESEFIAIFDADFIPPANFLRQTIPCFLDDSVGCVQARWGHVNPNTSPLTNAQALGIDGHFVVEQQARHTLGACLNFNGTAGIWRRQCLDRSGGWQGDTLTEDLDLSYRAQLNHWRIVYQPDVIVPAELPVQIDAFKRQQFRWAKGSMQTALKLLGPLWRSSHPWQRKLFGTFHLTNYVVHPLMLLNLLLILPMTVSKSAVLILAPGLVISALGPPLMYWMAMPQQGMSWFTRLRRLAVLMALGTGLSVNNSRAVMEAIAGIRSDFKRTPKFAIIDGSTPWCASDYALPSHLTVWLELLLALYALSLLGYSLIVGKESLVIWLLIYASGYMYVALLSLIQLWQRRAAQSTAINFSPTANNPIELGVDQ
ncbi:MAG: glycosyltransferase [Cyanothece sp. SIO1E1]|nr:glycosyltransferase [Cyanothece sp. SIO1E1]